MGWALTVLIQVGVEVLLGAQPVLELARVEVLHRALLGLNDLFLLHVNNFRKVVYKLGKYLITIA